MAETRRDINIVKRNIKKMIDLKAPEQDIDEYVKSENYTISDLQKNTVDPYGGVSPNVTNVMPEGTKALTPEDIALQKETGERALGGFSMGLLPYLAKKTGLVPPEETPRTAVGTGFEIIGGLLPGPTRGLAAGVGKVLSKLLPTRPIVKSAIQGGVMGGLYTPEGAQRTGEGFIAPGERLVQAGIGGAVGSVLHMLLKGASLFKNIKNIDSRLYPKAEKGITNAFKTMHSNIQSDLTAMETAYPGRKIIPANTYDEVAKYSTLDKKTVTAIKSIPELNKFMRSKVPGVIKTPLEAQTLKNQIREKLGQKAAAGEISIGKKELANLFEAIDKDITNAYPEVYPQIKSVYKEALDALDILEPLRNRANFRSELLKAKKGQGQALQAALSKVLPPDLANELITYANVPVKVTNVLEKTIRPKHVKPVLKRVIKGAPKG